MRTFDVLALPTRSRWGGILVGVYVNERNAQYNLLDTIFSAADEGVLSLAAIRDARGEPADFQIVHLNQGAARLLMQPATELLWRRLSAGGNPLAAPAVMNRLRGFVGGGPGGQFEIDSGDRCLRLGVTAFGDMRVAPIEQALKANWAASALDSVTIPASGLLADIHGSADYRANLIKVMGQRAVTAAG